MNDPKLVFGVVVFGGMALLLIIMFTLYLIARRNRLEREHFREARYGDKNIVDIFYMPR